MRSIEYLMAEPSEFMNQERMRIFRNGGAPI